MEANINTHEQLSKSPETRYTGAGGSEKTDSKSAQILTKVASNLFCTIRSTNPTESAGQRQFFVQSIVSEDAEIASQGNSFDSSLEDYSHLLGKASSLHKEHSEIQSTLDRLQTDLKNTASLWKQLTQIMKHPLDNESFGGLSMEVLPLMLSKLQERGVSLEVLSQAINYEGRDNPEVSAITTHIFEVQQEILASDNKKNLPSLSAYKDLQTQLDNKAMSLQPGEYMVIPGLSCSHAGLVKIERQPNDLFTVSIFNSGYGLKKYHQPLSSNPAKRATCFPKQDIPFLGPEGKPGVSDLIHTLTESVCLDRITTQGNRQSIDQVYKTLLEAPGSRVRTTNKDLFRKGQSGGSCSKECIDCFVSYELTNLTLKDSQKSVGVQVYKDIQLILKISALAALTKEHLASTKGGNQAEENALFLKQYAARVTKYLQQRQTISSQDAPPDHDLIMNLAEQTLNNIVKQLSPHKES